MSPEKVIIFESGDSAGRQGSKFGGKLGFSAISLSSKIMIILTKGIHVWPVFVLKRRLAIKFIHNRRIHKPLMFLFRQFGNLSVPKHQVRQNFLNKIEIRMSWTFTTFLHMFSSNELILYYYHFEFSRVYLHHQKSSKFWTSLFLLQFRWTIFKQVVNLHLKWQIVSFVLIKHFWKPLFIC